MSARQGPGPVSQIMYGSSGVTVSAIRLGRAILWSSTVLTDNADRADSIGLGVDWTDLGPSSTPNIASVASGYFRMNIDDDPTTGLTLQTDEQVYTLPAPGDDGYIETVPSSGGDTGDVMHTTLWRRADSTLTNGVGIKLENGLAYIVARIAGVETLPPTDQGAVGFVPGDILRLTQTGNLHELTRAGSVPLTMVWDDTGATAAKGSAYRRMAVTMQGCRIELTAGSGEFVRQYSAALDYVEMS